MNQDDSYSIITFPSSRLFTTDVGRIGLKKHHIKAIIELDVTDSRIKLKKIRSETGEHISFELRKIKKIIEENVIKIMEAWYEHCGESK